MGCIGRKEVPKQKELTINIHQPPQNENVSDEKKFTAEDDLTIEIIGNICGQSSRERIERYHPDKGGKETSAFYKYHSAKEFNEGKGYVLVDHYIDYEDDSIDGVCFTRFKPMGSCYEEKKLYFRDQDDPPWIVGICGEDGCNGDLYISKDGSKILKILQTTRKSSVGLAPVENVSDQRRLQSTYYLYSLETLEMITQGTIDATFKVENEVFPPKVEFRNAKYVLFRDWYEQSPMLKQILPVLQDKKKRASSFVK